MVEGIGNLDPLASYYRVAFQDMAGHTVTTPCNLTYHEALSLAGGLNAGSPLGDMPGVTVRDTP